VPVQTLIATKTVLIADDTAFVRDRFSSAIENAGHHAIAVRTGAELLALVGDESCAIDLIVLDLRLPDGGGIALLHRLRAARPHPPTILVFSGTIGNADEVRELVPLGVAGYINEYTAAQHIVPSLGPHLFPDHYNRRSSPRVGLATPVAYRVGNNIAAALTINISQGGVAIRTSSPLEIGTDIKLRFRLPSARRDVDASARVCWSDRRVGMGLEFTTIEPADRSAIGEFVEAHFFSNRKA
jgi:uncharacterized protein (TIGR02266 family)